MEESGRERGTEAQLFVFAMMKCRLYMNGTAEKQLLDIALTKYNPTM